jgi:hypothetical protein
MDYDKVGQSVTTLLKTAVPEGGTTSQYDKIPAVDEQRELIVSHLKSTYTTETGEMLNAKEFVDTSNTYKNMLKVADGELQTIHTKEKSLESNIAKQKENIEKSKHVNTMLQMLFVTFLIVIVIYTIGGSWAHSISLIILIVGFGIVLYTRGELPATDFSSIKQWISTTLGR